MEITFRRATNRDQALIMHTVDSALREYGLGVLPDSSDIDLTDVERNYDARDGRLGLLEGPAGEELGLVGGAPAAAVWSNGEISCAAISLLCFRAEFAMPEAVSQIARLAIPLGIGFALRRGHCWARCARTCESSFASATRSVAALGIEPTWFDLAKNAAQIRTSRAAIYGALYGIGVSILVLAVLLFTGLGSDVGGWRFARTVATMLLAVGASLGAIIGLTARLLRRRS